MIDRSELMELLFEWQEDEIEEDECNAEVIRRILQIVSSREGIDPVHAAGACRCKECEYYQDIESRVYDGKHYHYCANRKDMTLPDNFCSWGKRNE